MDLISSRTTEIAALGLDGLSARHKAIASNIANADTPGYKRIDVSFEDQLSSIMQTEDTKEFQKVINSAAFGTDTNNSQNKQGQSPLSVNYQQTLMEMSNFSPLTEESNINSPDNKGNTVNIEQEMSALTKTGMTYNALAALESKSFKGLAELIKGQ